MVCTLDRVSGWQGYPHRRWQALDPVAGKAFEMSVIVRMMLLRAAPAQCEKCFSVV
jgi:hypothetical protein